MQPIKNTTESEKRLNSSKPMSATKAPTQSINGKLSEAMKLVNEAKNETVTEVKEQVMHRIDDSMETFENLKGQTIDAFNDSQKQVTKAVNRRPLQFLLGAAAVGLVFGYFLRRK
jgi:ElaB/YqjD/DUF883 family membrane-anchored ribosome-binding protein